MDPAAMKPEGYRNLADLPEDQRIDVVIQCVQHGKACDLIIDDNPKKVARYQRKLIASGCALGKTVKGPREGEVTLHVRPKSSHDIQ